MLTRRPVARTAAVAVTVALAVTLPIAACRRRPPPPPPQATAEGLAAYLGALATRAPAAISAEVAGWPLDAALWRRTLVEPYRSLYDAVHPADRLRALAQGLQPGAFTARRHYAGDPRGTPGQAWLRWALPPLYPSFVAERDGAPLDTVFLHDGTRWRALAGLDDLIAARVRAAAPACADDLAGAAGSARCATAAWALADAALRPPAPGAAGDPVARACRIAATLCGKRSP